MSTIGLYFFEGNVLGNTGIAGTCRKEHSITRKRWRNAPCGKSGKKIGLALLGVLLLGYYGVLPLLFAREAVRSAATETGPVPEGYQAVELLTEDNLKLAAWYKSPDNGKTVIVVHGAGGNKRDMQGISDMVGREGYGVLALDLRGHGESQGRTNKFGWEGTKDIGAAVSFLKEKGSSYIGAVGHSLGGEVLLGAASTYPEIRAIVADGATCRSFEEFMDGRFASSAIQATSYTRPMFYWVRVFSGEQPPKPLLSSIRESSETQFLFIAAGDTPLERPYNEAFAEATAGRSSLWVAEGVSHTGAFGKYPDQYKQKVIELFTGS